MRRPRPKPRGTPGRDPFSVMDPEPVAGPPRHGIVRLREASVERRRLPSKLCENTMQPVSDAMGFLRLAAGLPTFVRNPISLETAKARIQDGMRQRSAAFVSMVEHAVFRNPSSPYLRLFRNAGCDRADLAGLLDREGLEETLEQLAQAGVYVELAEFKGLAPAVRGSQTFHFREVEFDNPLTTAHFRSSTGGSTGRPTRVVVDLEHIDQSAHHWATWFATHDLMSSPLVYYTPTHAGIVNGILRCARFGKSLDRWFAMSEMATWRDRSIAAAVQWMVRRAIGLPRPEAVSLADSGRIGEYLHQLSRKGLRPCLNTYPSAAARICRAMQERGIPLAGSSFLLRGEALTPARRAAIEAAGARAIQSYGFSEGGTVAGQCTCPNQADDVHVYADAFAIVQRERPVGEGESVGALLITGLRRASPKVLLNTEIGDDATVENRPCDCLFGELGYKTHLHSIRSFGKLTGEGMTFLRADLIRLLEEVLPAKFGGAPTDYQLLEEEVAGGLVRYTLLVSPSLGPLDSAAIANEFLGELSKMRRFNRFKARVWADAGTLQVLRRDPESTPRGKVLPIRTVNR